MQKLRTRTFALVAGALGAALAFAGCAATPSDSEPRTLTLSGPTDVSFDVGIGLSAYNGPAIQAVYDSLVVLDFTGVREDFLPWIATEWEMSEKRDSATFTIRDDVDFTDGTHLDAEGVVTALTIIRDGMAEAGSPGATQWEPYTFEVTGEYTFRVDTDAGTAEAAVSNVGLVSLASPKAMEDRESLAMTPVGSGPYILEDGGTLGVELSFTRNPDYWNPEAFPYDEITVKTFEDNVAALNALRSGQLDASVIDFAAATEAESAGLALHTGGGRVNTLYFGDRAGEIVPAIGDVRVRKAINMAFDRATIAETLDLGLGNPSSQVFVQGQYEYLDGRDDEYAYDIDAAKELLAEAGYPDGFDLAIPTWTYVAEVEPVVLQSLADIGIRATFDNYPDFASYRAAIDARRYAVMTWPEYTTNWYFDFLRPGGAFTIWGFDPRMDALIATIDNGSEDERDVAYQEVGELLLEEAWFAPFSSHPTVWATIPEITVQLHPSVGWTTLSEILPVDE
jgi:peptide/nickel transport system substrate-binding protein